jgi:hypothetical protein
MVEVLAESFGYGLFDFILPLPHFHNGCLLIGSVSEGKGSGVNMDTVTGTRFWIEII